MTVIALQGLETQLGADGEITGAIVQAQYWAGTAPYIAVDGADVVFPSPITVQIVDGDPASPIDLMPTDAACCVRWDVWYGVHHLTRYTTIPAVGPVEFGDLVDVDPATFVPTDDGLAAWEAIAASQIESGTVDSAGHLILTARDGSTQDAGEVRYHLPGWPDGLDVTMGRLEANASPFVPDSIPCFAYFTAVDSKTVSTLRFVSGNAGNGMTFCRFGLYSVAGNGDLTLVGSTPNDASLFTGPQAAQTKAMTAPVALVKGARYAIAILTKATVLAPQAAGMNRAPGLVGLAPRDSGRHASTQADLPASVAAASIINNAEMFYAEIF